MLNLINISQFYKQGNEKINVLDKINLEIKKNINVGILGPSGSGKTSFLNIIGLLENCKNGTVIINEINCSELNPEEKTFFRRKNIGFIFQNNQLLEDFTCEENVALPLILNGHSYKKSIMNAQDLLIKLGLKNRLKMKPSLLSGGEQQRVAILRALIKKPKILLSDEPTGSLDDKNAKEVFKQIINLSQNQNTITITATHNHELLSEFDVCYKINKGKLVEF